MKKQNNIRTGTRENNKIKRRKVIQSSQKPLEILKKSQFYQKKIITISMKMRKMELRRMRMRRRMKGHVNRRREKNQERKEENEGMTIISKMDGK